MSRKGARKNAQYTEEELAQHRHPAWAKGKNIGLFYHAKKLKSKGTDGPSEKKKKEENVTCIPLYLDPMKLEQIKRMLSKVEFTYPAFSKLRSASKKFRSVDEKYEYIGDSAFKKNFLSTIKGSISDIISEAQFTIALNRNNILDQTYMNEDRTKNNSPKYKSFRKFRKNLPAFEKKQEILSKLETNNVLVISGETGCGKTTQVPQFILESNIENGCGSLTYIICTQPRRISAISVAERVAEERGECLGKSVGYQIRLERKLPRDRGSILFCTTGVLLQFMRSDPLMKRVSHIILDEIHERDTLSDFLIALLKDIVPARPDLKIILMSATLNAEVFSSYFNNCPIVHIPGFTFAVKEYYLEDVIQLLRFNYRKTSTRKSGGSDDNKYDLEPFYKSLKNKYFPDTIKNVMLPEAEQINVDLIVELINHICMNFGPGAILVFLPGIEKIKAVNYNLIENIKLRTSEYLIIMLHSVMPMVNQKTVFNRPPAGVRKIILATNIAETSITIDDVVYVIDTGKVKIKNFDVTNNVSTLKEEWISLANSKQRRGRAGRVQEGVCFHLFVSGMESFLLPYQIPEILRTRLEEVILQAKILQLGKIDTFLAKVMDPPKIEAVELSLELLIGMNALDENEQLTPLGYHLATLPVDPHSGKMILLASMFACIDPLFSIAASLSFKDAFICPLGKEKYVDCIKMKIDGGQKSDHLMMAKVMYLWEQSQNPSAFCDINFLSSSILYQLRELKCSFSNMMYNMRYLPSNDLKHYSSNINSKNLALIKALVCGSLYPNVGVVVKLSKKTQFRKGGSSTVIRLPENDQKVYFHASSVNDGYNVFESRFFVYYEKIRSSNTYLFDSSMVYPLPLIFFCQKFQVLDERNKKNKIIEINQNIRFLCSPLLANLIIELRGWLDWLLEFKVAHPGITDWSKESDESLILRAITELLTIEHEMYGEGQYELSTSDRQY